MPETGGMMCAFLDAEHMQKLTHRAILAGTSVNVLAAEYVTTMLDALDMSDPLPTKPVSDDDPDDGAS